MENNFFKDKSPQDTIQTIRTILKRNNIIVLENTWYNKKNLYCSLSLGVDNTPLSVNGKGVTPLFALASAYGELMERMQNMSSYKLVYSSYIKDGLSGLNFLFAPDEKIISKVDFFEYRNPWLAKQIKATQNTSENQTIDRWNKISMCKYSDKYVCLPFFNVNTSKKEYIPLVMLSKMYATNGMAAGNTIEEAIVQGVSEIYERYAIKTIIKQRITPGDIPREEIYKDQLLKEMIENIEKSNRFKLYFKDCSIGTKLPVVAVICVDTSNGKYFIKFGSHPVFSIAVQRTLTELLQGQNLNEIRGMSRFEHNPKVACSNNNIYQIFLNGCGSYPQEFFADNANYDLSGFEQGPDKSNVQMLQHLFNDIKSRGWDLLVRDVSFLGFPSCQIIIPCISEVEQFDDISSLDSYIDFLDMKNKIQIIETLSKKELFELADSIQAKKHLRYVPPFQWLNLKQDNIPWVYKNTYLTIGALYLLADDYCKASSILNEFMHMASNAMPKQELYYFECATILISMISDGIELKTINEVLGKFYSFAIIEGAMKDFSKENIYKIFDLTCDVDNDSEITELKLLYKKICASYDKNVIIQEHLKEVFDW